jgi:hypothetical protein
MILFISNALSVLLLKILNPTFCLTALLVLSVGRAYSAPWRPKRLPGFLLSLLLGLGRRLLLLYLIRFGGGGDWLVGSLVAPYVYACWQKRCEILHPGHTAGGPPSQREVDGLVAMAYCNYSVLFITYSPASGTAAGTAPVLPETVTTVGAGGVFDRRLPVAFLPPCFHRRLSPGLHLGGGSRADTLGSFQVRPSPSAPLTAPLGLPARVRCSRSPAPQNARAAPWGCGARGAQHWVFMLLAVWLQTPAQLALWFRT